MRLVLGLLVIGTWPGALCAEDEPSPRDRWDRAYEEIARSLELRPTNEAATFELVTQPLLKYANPVRDWDQHGSLFLWVDGKRPAALGSIWSVEDRQQPEFRKVAYEFHSLQSHPVSATRGSEVFWKCTDVGLDWQLCPVGDQPAASPPLRQSQMRRIARSVSAKIATGESELRLMPRPLYQYAVPDQVIDGALFTFVMGTDPELFLLMEARDDREQSTWHWAFARFTHVGVTARCGDKVVFQCRHLRETASTRYRPVFNAERRPALLGVND